MVDVGGLLKGKEGADTAEFDYSTNTDDALRYVAYFMYDVLHSFVLNFNIYSKGKK